MKKRILAIMLVLPLLVAFAAMGFTKLISLTVPQMPEDIKIEYDANEAFEFEGFGNTMELKGEVIPQTSGQTVVWQSSNPQVAQINGSTLTFVDEGTATISASLADGTLKRSFTAMFMLSGDEPKYIKANFETPTEKGPTVIGLKDYANSAADGATKPHTEVINCSVLPSKAPQNITVEGLPGGTYTVEGTKISFTPQQTGTYTAKIISADNPAVSYQTEFEVKDCVNIYSYDDLIRATNNSPAGTPLALRVNLESAANLGRTNSVHYAPQNGGAYSYQTFESTYDTDYLKNSKLDNHIKAAVVFRADVYGNGHTINLHDFAYPTETDPATGIAIPGENDVFSADPLPFVTAAGLTVCGQGNAGFMVLGDGITLDNIVLKNCNNVSDLSNLNYVGTVLEVDGDNVAIKNSTLQNGRTVVRSFSNEGLLIENCILAYAREFIYKQGSNQSVHPGQAEDLGQDWNESAKSWDEAQKDLFDYDRLPEAAKRGDSTATIKDTSFYTSGIFCIGMDTHFAGELLYKWLGSNKNNVKNLAATSYKSTLNLEGDIKFYDWKIASNMDSSTLVSGAYQGVEFKLDIYGLLKRYDETYGAGSVIKTVDGVKYVHGGIAFFGGGNNLSEVYLNGKSVKATTEGGGLNDDKFISLSVALTDKNLFNDSIQSMLFMAAGTGPFYFCIYRSSYEGIGIKDTPFN